MYFINWDNKRIIYCQEICFKKIYIFGLIFSHFILGCLLYIQLVYSPVIKMMAHKDGFVAMSQHGSFIKESFCCPDSLKPKYNPLRNFRAHYRVTSREKSQSLPHTVINDLQDYNPAQFNFIGMMKSKPSNTCVVL